MNSLPSSSRLTSMHVSCSLGLLLLLVGSTLYGVALLVARAVPAWAGWLLVAAGPGGVLLTVLWVGHIPSGPTLPFALAWIVLGYALWRRGCAKA